MKKINSIILILLAMLCTGCTRQLAGKLDDFNETYTGTITSNIQNKPIITIKSNSTGLTCSGEPGITSFTPFNEIHPIFNGMKGAAYLKCEDNTRTYINWEISNFKRKSGSGKGEDVYGHKLSFYFDFDKKNVDEKLKQYKTDVANKPLLKRYNPVLSNENSKEKGENNKLPSDIDFYPYMRNLQQKIKSNCPISDVYKPYKVVTGFDIDKYGLISNIKIIQSSGSKIIDNGAIKAIVLSSPAEPLPNGFKEEKLSIKFTFDTTVINYAPNPSKNMENCYVFGKMTKQPDKEDFFTPYMKNIQKIIKSNWHPADINQTNKIITLFDINRQGTISNIKLIKSSRIEENDGAVIKAIKTASPLPPLPVEFEGNNIKVQFTFDTHVFK